MSKPNRTPDLALLNLAAGALRLAMAGHLNRAFRVVEEIATDHGGNGVWVAMQAWVDTFILQTGTDPAADGAAVALGFFNAETGEAGTADDVPPSIAWAGRFIAARAANDRIQAEALFHALQGDRQWSDAVAAVLSSCALNIRALQAGTYAGSTADNPYPSLFN